MVRLPEEYQEVEYIESTGTQYVQTSYTPQNTDEITCDFSIIGSIVGLSNTQALFSAGTGTTQLILLLCHFDGANPVNGAYYKYFASRGAKQFNFYPSYNSKYRLTISSNGTAFCNGYSVQSAYEGVVNTSLRLMRRANNAAPFLGRLYNFVLSNSGIKKLDLIPCYRKSDNKPGMYDTVSGTFYANSGGGEFLVGNNVYYDTTNLMESRRRILLTTPHLESPTPANPLTFKTDMTTKLKEGKVYFTPIQEGEGDPSPDNVRPISGWDGITVTKCGKNLLGGDKLADFLFPNGDYVIHSDGNGRYIEWRNIRHSFVPFPSGMIKDNRRYTFIAKVNSTGDTNAFVLFYTDSSYANWTTTTGLNTKKYLTATNKTISGLRLQQRSATIKLYIDESGLFEDNIDITSYEPYQGTTITIPFPKTIYGGYVDLVNGEVVEEWGVLDLGEVNWGTLSGNRARIGNFVSTYNTIAPKYSSAPLAIAEKYSGRSAATTLKYSDFAITKELILYYDGKNNPSGKIVYPLATPIHHTIDPQVIGTLKGVNNIWSDANGNIEIKFWKH